jgi:hypothetical protein
MELPGVRGAPALLETPLLAPPLRATYPRGGDPILPPRLPHHYRPSTLGCHLTLLIGALLHRQCRFQYCCCPIIAGYPTAATFGHLLTIVAACNSTMHVLASRTSPRPSSAGAPPT